jgi:hypothetical protein
MFPTAHPDITGQLANERAADLRAAARRYRISRAISDIWHPARLVEPAADLSRAVPAAPHAEASKAGRAA